MNFQPWMYGVIVELLRKILVQGFENSAKGNVGKDNNHVDYLFDLGLLLVRSCNSMFC